MIQTSGRISVLLVFMGVASGFAQVKSKLAKESVGEYKSSKEYCFDHPKSPICVAGHEVPGVSGPKATPPPAPAPGVTQTRRPANGVQTTTLRPAPTPQMLVVNQTDWRFAHPHADVLMSINVEAFLQSPVIAAMLEKMAASAPVHGKSGLEKLKRTLGAIDRISVSVRQFGNRADGIAMLTGSFDEQSVPGIFKDKDGDIARVAGLNSVLIGQEPAVNEALRRMAATNQTAAPKADGLEASDIWMAGDPRILFRGAQGISAFSIGMNLRDPVQITFHVTASGAAAADQLTAAFQKAEAKATQQPAAGKSLRVERSGLHVWLKASAPMGNLPAELPGGSLQARMEPLFALLDQLPAPSASAPVAAPKKIMIYGLDDGPKEVGKPQQ